MILNIISEPDDLFMAILRWDRNEDRFVVAATNHFDLAALRHGAKPFEIFRMRTLQQFEQRAGEVQPDADGRMAGENLHEGQIGLLVGALDYVVKIPHRLVRMHEEGG